MLFAAARKGGRRGTSWGARWKQWSWSHRTWVLVLVLSFPLVPWSLTEARLQFFSRVKWRKWPGPHRWLWCTWEIKSETVSPQSVLWYWDDWCLSVISSAASPWGFVLGEDPVRIWPGMFCSLRCCLDSKKKRSPESRKATASDLGVFGLPLEIEYL